MFNNSLEKNRYSLRKLSVGLASVLIGISFIEVNGQTAKADTVDGGNTATISTKVEKTTNASDANKGTTVSNGSLGVANSANAGQESVKGNSSQNYNANDGAEATTAKTEAVKGTITNAKAALDAANDAKTNSTIDANQANTDAKGAADEAQTSNIIQENNINVETTKDAQVENGVNMQTLDVNKNSKPLDNKVLATNLTQDNSTQDISKITDPSKIDASHFANGTRWTPAGWTRMDKNTLIAKSSKLNIDWIGGSPTDIPTQWLEGSHTTAYLKDISFSVDKNDLKAENKILVGAIQNIPTGKNKQSADFNEVPGFSGITTDALEARLTYNGQTIGTLTVESTDVSEIDVYFNVNKTISNLVTDPTFKYIFDGGNILDTATNSNYTSFFSYKNHLKYPLSYSLVSNSNILNYKINANKNAVWQISPTYSHEQAYIDSTWEFTGKAFNYYSNQQNPTNIQTGFVYKITTLEGDKPALSAVDVRRWTHMLDASGSLTNGSATQQDTTIYIQRAADNLTSADLWNATASGQAMQSVQQDGSVLICIKPNSAQTSIDKNLLNHNATASYLPNVQDPEHAEQIINNTVKQTKSWADLSVIFPLGISNVNQIHQVIDVTPSNVGEKHNVGTFIVGSASHGGHSDTDLETYKTVKISYVDDDATDPAKNIVSSDAMNGRQNKASTYTVNIPKGYYLDDNNTSTGYTWNTDHTAIFYTFDEDQAKNDANPIEIHLRHIHSAVKDDKYLKNTSVRTIAFDFPAGHGDPEVITQTIGWTRTGTYDEVTAAAKSLDEAEKEGNYTDWVFTSDPATTKVTVTVNGKDDPTLASKYQSYDQQVYAKDNSDVEFAAIPIPKIPGYKAQFVQDKANPAMLLVSFMALPNTNDASKGDNAKTDSPAEPVNPSDDTKPAINVPVTPSDPKDTVPKSPIAAPSVPVEVKDTQDTTFDKLVEAPAVQATADPAWHIKDEANDAATYTVANTTHTLSLPKFDGYTLRLVKRNAARDAISFVYVNPNKTLKYVFNIKIANGKYILAISKVSKDGIIPLEKVTFSDYNRLIQLIAKAVNR